MKTILVFLLLFCVVATSRAQRVCLYDLENRKAVYYQNDEPYSGEFECFNAAGRLVLHGFLSNGLLDSVVISYDNKGNILKNIVYDKGRIIEQMICTDETLWRTCETYKGDTLHGPWERTFINDFKKIIGHYENGEPVGKWYILDKHGNVFVENTFTEDSVFQVTYQKKKNKQIMWIEKSSKARPYIMKREKIVTLIKE
jgi:antitoxin component YwqK of YwqJK toxin-antitoxin module